MREHEPLSTRRTVIKQRPALIVPTDPSPDKSGSRGDHPDDRRATSAPYGPQTVAVSVVGRYAATRYYFESAARDARQ